MSPWSALGIFLLEAWAGPLSTGALHTEQIRKLKEPLKPAQNNSQTEGQGHKSNVCKSA
jgi:hypothetical protein